MERFGYTLILVVGLVLGGRGPLVSAQDGVSIERNLRSTFQKNPLKAIQKLTEQDRSVQLSFLDRLLRGLKSRNWDVRVASDRLLVKLGKEAPDRVVGKILSFLRKQVQKRHDDHQTRLIRVLGDIGPPAKRAVKPLIGCLQSPFPAVRQETVLSLGKIGRPAKEAIPHLVKLTHSSDMHLRWFAWNALNEIATRKELVRVLPKINESPDSELGALAKRKLVRLGKDITIPTEGIFQMFESEELSDGVFLDMVQKLRQQEDGVSVSVPLLTERGVFLSGVPTNGVEVDRDAGPNGAYVFSGREGKGNNLLRLGTIPIFQGAGAFTISLWFKLIDRPNNGGSGTKNEPPRQVLFVRGSEKKGDSMKISLQGPKLSVFLDTGENRSSRQQTVKVRKDQWHHLALAYDPSRTYETYLYIDGSIEKAWKEWGGELNPHPDATTQLGNNKAGTAPFSGGISDVYLLKRGFDTEMVKRLKGSGSGRE